MTAPAIEQPEMVVPQALAKRLLDRANAYAPLSADDDATTLSNRWLKRAIDLCLEDFPEPLPEPNVGLPFFAYGSLKHGELAFNQIGDFCDSHEEATLCGHMLKIRDGLPILVQANGSLVRGEVICFNSNTAVRAYDKIRGFEPAKQYKWVEVAVERTKGHSTLCNALLGRKPNKGASAHDGETWTIADDRLLGEGLARAALLARADATEFKPANDFFQLQAAFLLLWAVVERYASFTVGPALGPIARLTRIEATDDFKKAFADAEIRVSESGESKPRRIVDVRDPEKSLRMEKDGIGAMDFWYQVRCNVTHRGKSVMNRDPEILWESFVDVHDVFRSLLVDAVPNIVGHWRDEPLKNVGWRIRKGIRGHSEGHPARAK